MKLCSACLLGVKCRYDGLGKANKQVLKLLETELLIPVCPEQLGGFSTPRASAEIQGGDGFDVLDGIAKVFDSKKDDVTDSFISGAAEVLKVAQMYGIKSAILKQRSPSCGNGEIYDGTFSGKVIAGDGVTTALLKKEGIEIVLEEEL